MELQRQFKNISKFKDTASFSRFAIGGKTTDLEEFKTKFYINMCVWGGECIESKKNQTDGNSKTEMFKIWKMLSWNKLIKHWKQAHQIFLMGPELFPKDSGPFRWWTPDAKCSSLETKYSD